MKTHDASLCQGLLAAADRRAAVLRHERNRALNELRATRSQLTRAYGLRDLERTDKERALKDLDLKDHELAELKAEMEDHRRGLFVPGLSVCVVCSFEHQALSLRAKDGAVLVSSEPKPLMECPNGCGYLVVVTWQQRAEEAISRVVVLSSEVEDLRARLARPLIPESGPA